MTERNEHHDRRHWTFTQLVPTILSLLAVIAAVFGAYSALDTRISLLEQATTTEINHTNEWRARMDAAVDEINRKLDRLTEGRK